MVVFISRRRVNFLMNPSPFLLLWNKALACLVQKASHSVATDVLAQ